MWSGPFVLSGALVFTRMEQADLGGAGAKRRRRFPPRAEICHNTRRIRYLTAISSVCLSPGSISSGHGPTESPKARRPQERSRSMARPCGVDSPRERSATCPVSPPPALDSVVAQPLRSAPPLSSVWPSPGRSSPPSDPIRSPVRSPRPCRRAAATSVAGPSCPAPTRRLHPLRPPLPARDRRTPPSRAHPPSSHPCRAGSSCPRPSRPTCPWSVSASPQRSSSRVASSSPRRTGAVPPDPA